jgi:superfamily I DNA/RNA helicase
MAIADLVEQVWERTGYLRELQAEGTIEALGREENVRELRSVAHGVVAEGRTPSRARAGRRACASSSTRSRSSTTRTRSPTGRVRSR